MIIYSDKNVYEAAKDRIRTLFDMGRPLGVCFSGGKDSTALLFVTLEVARERGIKKIPVSKSYSDETTEAFLVFAGRSV